MKNFRLSSLNDYSIYFFIAGLALYFMVYLINGEDNVINTRDNLDSEILFRKLPKEAGVLFSISNQTEVPQVMNGLKRNAINASVGNVETYLFYFFTPFYAYIFNFILVNILGFAGVYLLSSRYILKGIKDQNKILSALMAFAYVLLPAYTIYGLTIIALPLLTYCILNVLYGENRIGSWLFIVIYPFWSSLVLGGFAVISLIFVAGLYYLFLKKNKSWGYSLIKISILIGCLYFLAEINLINQFLFDKEFVSHRTGWAATLDQFKFNPEGIGFAMVVDRFVDHFLNGFVERRPYHQLILVFLVILGILNFKQIIRNKYIIATLSLLVLISIVYAVFYWNAAPLVYLKEQITLLRTFRLDRVHMLNQALWYILLALLIKQAFNQKKKYLVVLTYLILFVNIGYVFINSEFKSNLLIALTNKQHSMITWEKFYAEDLFDKVKQDIDEPLDSFRTVSIGVFPAVAQYNGFYTLDSYQNNYPLEYKNQFRKIIASELEKSERWRSFYDDWGSECFVFVAELDKFYRMYITKDVTLENLELDTKVLYEMGGKYVISAVEIGNYQENNLLFIDKYTDKKTPLKIFLYQVKPPESSS